MLAEKLSGMLARQIGRAASELTPCRLLPQPGAQFSATAEPDSLHGGGHSTAERALREQLSSARLESGQDAQVQT